MKRRHRGRAGDECKSHLAQFDCRPFLRIARLSHRPFFMMRQSNKRVGSVSRTLDEEQTDRHTQAIYLRGGLWTIRGSTQEPRTQHKDGIGVLVGVASVLQTLAFLREVSVV